MMLYDTIRYDTMEYDTGIIILSTTQTTKKKIPYLVGGRSVPRNVLLSIRGNTIAYPSLSSSSSSRNWVSGGSEAEVVPHSGIIHHSLFLAHASHRSQHNRPSDRSLKAARPSLEDAPNTSIPEERLESFADKENSGEIPSKIFVPEASSMLLSLFENCSLSSS